MTEYEKLLQCPYCGNFLPFRYKIMKSKDAQLNIPNPNEIRIEGVLIIVQHHERCFNCGKPIRTIGEYIDDEVRN